MYACMYVCMCTSSMYKYVYVSTLHVFVYQRTDDVISGNFHLFGNLFLIMFAKMFAYSSYFELF
jgi:hypothetical protein